MSNSPFVKFNLVNKNVAVTTPTSGISAILARTTKGPQNDASILVNSVTKFEELYGKEIVPDGSVSNVEKALAGGSTLRIVRVQASDATKGVVGTASTDLFTFTSGNTTVGFGLQTKNKGDVIGSGSSYSFKAAQVGNNVSYQVIDADGSTVLDSGNLFSYMTADTVNKTSFDYLALNNFFNSNPFFEPIMVTTDDNITSIDDLISWLAESIDGTSNAIAVEFNGNALTSTYASVSGTVGSAGTTPALADWKEALDAIKDYNDMYQVAASSIYQHLSSADALLFHTYAKQMADRLEEWVYYIEVPKDQDTKAKIVTWMGTTLSAVGHSKFVAYFGGGIKYYNYNGTLKDSDVLGSVMGLGDYSAANYGPYKSFAGMNRGILPDALGPVCPNYGSPSRYDELNELAQNYVNMIVIKDTRSAGKVTMLWHSFTSQVKQDSFRFLNIVRLCLYLKKQLRPILESYIEEPNIWSSWKRIYLEGKPIMDNLAADNALTDWVWDGDQDATAWDQLKVNNEADCRQGKYKLQIHFKDVATMQEITVDLILDQASNSVSASFND
jgi:hypothetical protein